MPILNDMMLLQQARRQIGTQNNRPFAKKGAPPKQPNPRNMRDTLDAAARGPRPFCDVLRDDRAIYMDPWCAATVIAQLGTHGVGLLAQVNFLGAARAAARGQNPLPAFQRFVALSLVMQAVPKDFGRLHRTEMATRGAQALRSSVYGR